MYFEITDTNCLAGSIQASACTEMHRPKFDIEPSRTTDKIFAIILLISVLVEFAFPLLCFSRL